MIKVKLAGIYKIQCENEYYIGMSVDIFSRWQNHYTEFKQNIHHSPQLQEMYNKYGIEKMNFQVLEYISLSDYKKTNGLKGNVLKTQFRRFVLNREKYWMSLFSKNFSLNKDKKYFS